ncbi:MAG TPA: SAM-dependent methyltransferase, partial [Afipia sp.]|nr:SAM-dependent methyltransferase [Afipia sp.]
YRRADVVTAPSNEAFDASLKSRNPEWGLRDLEAVAELARTEGFSAPAITEMPANNLSVVFRRM